ncbi:MAG: hypothetical protein ACM3IJ_04910 [Candidatus Levyibacteriota bacterium]
MRIAEAPRPYLQPVRTDRLQDRNILRVTEQDQTVPELAREIVKINAKGPGERRLYSLEGTGFHIESQIGLLVDNYKNGVPVAQSFQQIEQDIHGFNMEYLKEAPVFGIPLKKREVAGETRIVGKLYADKLWEDTTDAIEREGVVKESVRGMAKKLEKAAPGSMFVFHSGEGWSGYQVRGGNLEKLNEEDLRTGMAQEVRYPDSQTYLVKVNTDGKLTAVTLKAHMSLSQSEAFIGKLTGQEIPSDTELTEKERIKRVVGTVVEFSPEDGKSPKDIVKVIKQIVGSNVAYSDSTGRDRTFDEMMFMLQNPQSLEDLDETSKRLVGNFREYAKWRMGFSDAEVESDLRTALGYTVLRLMHETQGEAEIGMYASMEEGRAYSIEERNIIPFDPRKALEEMQKRPGCAGGGNTMKVDSVSPRAGVFGNEASVFSNEEDKWFNCPKCKYKADGPVGNTCPGCGLTKEKYAQEEGVEVCD